MGAFYNSYLFDVFGVVLKKDPADLNTDVDSEVLKGQEAFDFLIGELDATEPDLPTKSQVGSGRFTKGAASMLKVRLYLNKAVYLDRYAASFNFAAEDMNQVVSLCDQIIGSNEYDLEREDYFRIFDIDNNNHPEHIFALNHVDIVNNGGRFIWFTLSRAAHGSLENPQSRGTDGGAITPDFWATWQDNQDDPRFSKVIIPQDGSMTSISEADWGLNRGFLVGQQYGIVLNEDGSDFKRAENGDLAIEMLYNFDRDGAAVVHTPEVDLEVNFGHSQGVRVSKNEFDPHATNGRNISRVDQVLMRLADVYLMRAEAKLRLGDAAGAVADVNAVRTARNHPRLLDVSDMDLEALYLERGYELYWEMVRRTDMIRFGKFEDTWTSKTDNDPMKRVFPIPQQTIDASPDLFEQNQGY
jgi:hypothetical protein